MKMVWLCLLASLIWGANIVFMKALLASQPALCVAFWRVFFSAGVLFVLARLQRRSFRIDKKELRQLSILGLLNVTLNFSFSFMAMALINGTSTAMLNALSPVIILLLMWIFYHQKPENKKIAAAFVTLLGVGCSFDFDWQNLSAGHLLLVLSLGFYSGSFLLGRGLKTDSIIKSFYTMLFGGIFLGLWLVFRNELTFLQMGPLEWLLFSGLSVAGFSLIQWIYFKASEEIGMKKTSFYMNFNPLFTYLGSVLFLNEPLTVPEIAAMCLVLAGLWLSKD